MRKMVFGRQLSRSRKARKSLFRSLARGLVLEGKIQTTRAKAKSVQGFVEKLVNLAKKSSISARRFVLSELGNDKKTTEIIFNKVAPVFSQRKSGYTKIILLNPRPGDKAEMVRIEWVENIDLKAKVEEKKVPKIKKVTVAKKKIVKKQKAKVK